MHLPSVRFQRESLTVLLSLGLQVPLAVLLGHYYDERVFMATGYVVSSGLNPYQPHILAGVFSSPYLSGAIPSIGYPPLWPLLLGLIYGISFNIVPNVFLYNFAIKVPVIVGNVALAYTLRSLILKLNANKNRAQYAWLFIIFNPFVLLTTVAWGEFDTIIALLCIFSFYLLSKGMIKESAFLLAIGVILKPIALPLVGLPFLFSPANNQQRKNLRFLAVFSVTLGFCYFAPFFLEGWALPWGPQEWNAHLQMAGGLTSFNIVEILTGSLSLPSTFEFLGYIWIPALLVGYYLVYRNRPKSFNELLPKAVALTLIFFLTRSWLSEPNINLILPLMLLTISTEKLNFRNFHFAWVIPFAFMFLNTSFPQLFFLVYPSVIPALSQLDQQIRNVRLLSRFLITIPWQILSWNIVIKQLRRNSSK